MEQLLKHTSNIKRINKNLLLIIPSLFLASCNSTQNYSIDDFAFNTLINISYNTNIEKNTNKEFENKVKNIIFDLDKKFNFYQEEGEEPGELFSFNSQSGDIKLSDDVYTVLKTSINVYEPKFKNTFSVRTGNVNKIWKENLAKKTIPNEAELNAQKEIISSSTIEFFEDNITRKNGGAKYDLGSVAKGYALSKVQKVFSDYKINDYVLNLGSSSIGIGKIEKEITIKEYNLRFKTSSSYVTTSSIHEQKVKIGDKYYSHIVNPQNFSAIPLNEQVIIINDDPFFADACSTALMNWELEDIKAAENEFNIKTIVFKNGQNIYTNPDIKTYAK